MTQGTVTVNAILTRIENTLRIDAATASRKLLRQTLEMTLRDIEQIETIKAHRRLEFDGRVDEFKDRHPLGDY
jgi:hypothetical protein